MAKRRVTFEDPEGEGEEELRPPRKRVGGGPGSRFPGQPSLDSDEEEEEEEGEGQGGCDALELEGQEAGPAEGVGEGEVPLTPFNLAEELAEGSFHPWGGFIPHRPPPPPDPWLETIEGMQFKPPPAKKQRGVGEGQDASEAPPPSPPPPPPLPPLLRGVLALLQPGETVGAALRRLGGGGRGGGRGQRGRGRGSRPAPPPQLEELVELADGLVARGVLGVFQETRERLELRLRGVGEGRGGEGEGLEEGEGPGSPSPSQRPAPALDIFAAEEEEEEEEEEKGAGPLPEVLWEYQWQEEGGDGRLYGPFSSAQMQEWAAQGYFAGGGARCRRVEPPGPFYDCARVDFGLYS